MKSGEELRAKGRERTNRWRARRREGSEWAFKEVNKQYQRGWRAKKVVGDVKEEDKDGRIRGRGTSDKGQIDGVAEGEGAGEDIGACGIAAGDDDSWDRVRDGGERGSGDSAESEEGLIYGGDDPEDCRTPEQKRQALEQAQWYRKKRGEVKGDEGHKLIRYASEWDRREAFKVLKAAVEVGVEIEGW
jgi:hypothetical protein